MAGKTYTEVLNTMVAWTPAYLAEFQQKTRFGEQTSRCQSRPILAGESEAVKDEINPRVTYPVIEDEYSPPDTCASGRGF